MDETILTTDGAEEHGGVRSLVAWGRYSRFLTELSARFGMTTYSPGGFRLDSE
jgi:hypothetical protein